MLFIVELIVSGVRVVACSYHARAHQAGRSSGAAVVAGQQSVQSKVAPKSSPMVSSLPLKIPHEMAEPPDAGNRTLQSPRQGEGSEQSKMIDSKVYTHTRARVA